MDWLLFCYFLLVEDIILHVHYKLYYSTWKTPLKPLFQLVSTIFYFCTLLLIAFQKLWKMPFLSSKKLFLFSKYSNFCNIWPPFPHCAIQKDNWSCKCISGIQLYNKQYNWKLYHFSGFTKSNVNLVKLIFRIYIPKVIVKVFITYSKKKTLKSW